MSGSEIKMKKFAKYLTPARTIALGFAGLIFLGSVLFMLPFSVKEPGSISYIDALYTSASAVCVTGLLAFDPGVALTPIGQGILAVLMQIGGLGVATVGASIILMMRKKINVRGRNIIREAGNLGSGKGVVQFVIDVLITTLIIELAGAISTFIVLIQDMPFPEALGKSLFHSIAAFNNAGFDIFAYSSDFYSNGSIAGYHDNVFFNIVTMMLIILGGIGFLVIREVMEKKWHWKKYSMHARVVIVTSAALILLGALLIKLTEGGNESWLGAIFQSVTTRTAGFSTSDLSSYSDAGLIVLISLMFIGASPGSTGGGIKTTTFFVIVQGIKSAATNKSEKAFKYSLPKEAFKKAAVIAFMGIGIILVSTFLLLLFEADNPSVTVRDALFEMTSAFGTVGLSTGISQGLSLPSKILSILIMYIGRLGPLTIATLWYFNKGERVEYPEGNIAIG